jgi:hypothetical protein
VQTKPVRHLFPLGLKLPSVLALLLPPQQYPSQQPVLPQDPWLRQFIAQRMVQWLVLSRKVQLEQLPERHLVL